ncbi:hypothetical protein ACRS6B_13855 [Nocardia asteroides]
MSNADDVDDLIDEYRHQRFNISDYEARELLHLLAELDENELAGAFERLSSRGRETLAHIGERQGLGNDDEYREIIAALSTGNPSGVADTESEEAREPAPEADFEVTFADGSGESRLAEGPHREPVKLWVPDGAGRSLISLIEDTQFAMQWGFDTLGADPRDRPDFAHVLGTEQVTTAAGWARIAHTHDRFREELEDRQQEYTAADNDVEVNTQDSGTLNEDTFRELKRIKDDLNERLKFDLPIDRERDDVDFMDNGDIVLRPGGDVDPIIIYQRDDSGKHYLTEEAEQLYYVRHIDSAVAEWKSVYESAVEEFVANADNIDNAGGSHDEQAETADASAAEAAASAAEASAESAAAAAESAAAAAESAAAAAAGSGTYPLPDGFGQHGSIPDQDLSPTYDDLLTESSDVTDSGDPVLGVVDDAASSTELGPPVQTESQNGFPAGTGVATGNVVPAADRGGADMLGPMIAMSALSQMGNHMNRPLIDDRAHDDRARDDRGSRNGSNGSAPAANTSPAVLASHPASTMPTYVGAPPPVSAPGAMVDYRLPDNSTVKVSTAVAQALQQQQQNIAMDAKAAYMGTAGENTPDNPWATVNDIAQLQTGDTVEWDKNGEKRYGLIVKNGNGMFVMDGGQLIPLDPNNPPLSEKYGTFMGYFHPTGLDAAANGVSTSATQQPVVTGAAAGKPADSQPVAPPQL